MTNVIKEKLNIIHENEHLLVIDKASGVVVNRSSTSKEGTIQDLVDAHYSLEKLEDLRATLNDDIVKNDPDCELEMEEFTSRSGILHRLDKDTSGVLIIAKTFESFRKYKSLFKNREIKKEYIAIVMGEIKDAKLEIDAPLKRNPQNAMKFAVVSEGKPAVTLVEKIKIFKKDDEKFTLLRVFPLTGRTHQIRVHLCAINHPIVGDIIYLTRHNYIVCAQYFNRLMLHAKSLSFKDPYTEELVSYAADVPTEFEN